MNLFLLLFIIVPIVEMMILIEVGSLIGAFYTILLVLLTAMIGVSLLKKQGLSTLLRANEKMSTGQMPVSEIGEGMMLAMAGALLLTPGFVTDTLGFIFLTPGLRQQIAVHLVKRFVTNAQSTSHYSHYEFRSGQGTTDYSSRSEGNDVIDGEFEQVDEPKAQINRKKDL